MHKLIIEKIMEILSEDGEKNFKIKVKHPGILEVPEKKDIRDFSVKHFKKLINKKGWEKVSRALINLQVWNKNKNPELSKWANSMHDRLAKWVEEKEK